MPTVLFTWEFGGGLGHLVNILPLAKGLRERGHHVVAAVRDPPLADRVFQGMDVQCHQAPVVSHRPLSCVKAVRSFAHLLVNNGFDDRNELQSLSQAWRDLYESVRPDVIVFDHSPTAILAARSYGAKKVLLGTGFFCPIDEYPLTDLRPWLGNAGEQLHIDEDRVRENINHVLTAWGLTPLERLSQLYHQVDENFLVTFPELDHYGARPNVRYWGAWPNIGGKEAIWPDGNGKRVYAYLKPFPALPKLLSFLNDLKCPAIVYMAGAAYHELQQHFESGTLRFESEWLNLAHVARECDLAILNGNHGTTVSMLMVGRPTLQIPLFLEQGLFSMAIERLGAGISIAPDKPELIQSKLNSLLTSGECTKGAVEFARRYADFDPKRQIEAIVTRIDELLHG
jgi:hypothetical protein